MVVIIELVVHVGLCLAHRLITLPVVSGFSSLIHRDESLPVELALRAGRAVERERRLLVLLRNVDPVRAPAARFTSLPTKEPK